MTSRARRVGAVISVVVALQVVAVLVYWAVERARTRAPPPPFVADLLGRAQAAPGFQATHPDGSPVIVTWPVDRVRVVHFWATWCEPCRDELPGLLALGRDLRGRGLEVVAVAVDDDPDDIRTFFAGEVPPEVVQMREAGAHKAWGVSTLPDTYVVDRSGGLVERLHGARDWHTPAARAHLEQLVR